MNGRRPSVTDTGRRAAAAAVAAAAGLILAAALTADPNHPAPNPTPTGYRPPLMACDYARTVSTCPTLQPFYVPPRATPTVRRSAPNATARPRTVAPRPARTR
jgi:hypothetical protein